MSAAKRALPKSKGASALTAAGLALFGAAGVALRKRSGGDETYESKTPATPPPVSPSVNSRTPDASTSPVIDPDKPTGPSAA